MSLVTPAITPPASNPNASTLLRRATDLYVTTLAAAISSTDTTIALGTTQRLSTDTAVTLVIDPGDNVKEETIIGFVVGNNLVNCVRHVEGATINHALGAVVMAISTAMDHNSIVDFGLAQHNGDGSHKSNFTVGGQTIAQVVSSSAFTPGMLQMTAGTAAPTGWLLADGSAVSQTTYSSLFAVIGSSYNTGGEGIGTFRLPSMLGKTPVGFDGAQTEFNTLGKTGGEKFHLLSVAEMPSHAHAVVDPGHTHLPLVTGSEFIASMGNGGTYTAAGGANLGFRGQGVTNTGTTGISVSNTGASTAHNNLQPYITVNYIIKT